MGNDSKVSNLIKSERLPISVVAAGVAISTIFGLSFLFTKNAIEHVDVYTFLSYRFAVAFAFMNLLVALRIVRLKKAKYYKLIPLVAFQPILYFTFEINGLRYSTSAEAGMLMALIPIVVNLLAYFLLGERGNWLHYLLVGIAFFGVILIVGFEFSSRSFLGKLLLIGAVFSAGFYNILSRKFSRDFEPVQITYFMMLVGFVYFTLTSLIRGQFEINLQLEVLTGALYLGILSSAIAFFLVNFMIKRVSPIVTSMFSNLTTVVSLIAGIAFRNEKITLLQILGMCVVLAAVVSLSINGINNSKLKPEEYK